MKFISFLLAFIIQITGFTSFPFGKAQQVKPVDSQNGGDPFMVEVDGKIYYTYTTGGGIDIVEINSCFDTTELSRKTVYYMGNDGIVGDIWAPEIHKIGNKWYIVAAGLFDRNAVPEGTMPKGDGKHEDNDYYRYGFVLESVGEDIFGDYVFKGRIAPDGLNNIDGTYLQKDGKLYYVCSAYLNVAHQALVISEMENPYTLKLNAEGESEAEIISKPFYHWEKQGWNVNEGPAVLYKGDKIYIVYSASGYYSGSYCLGMLTLTGCDVLNKLSWYKSPVSVFAESEQEQIYHPGHCSFIYKDSGEIFMVYHATAYEDFFKEVRHTYIRKVEFLGDYPLFNIDRV